MKTLKFMALILTFFMDVTIGAKVESTIRKSQLQVAFQIASPEKPT